ncbi:hypothetical protein EZV62_003597 [Acer yangbiense]|uniref:Uncharacterized protein n=1 Tax=Acer yangbiense TaxID=1000413 RepID=A0A5C7IJ23_9ROSI|nr:hypothetical protein EZV62_003597 [Acer yangbiense]
MFATGGSDAHVNLWYDLTASDKSMNSGVGMSPFEQMMMMSGLWNNLAIRKSPRTCRQLSYVHVIVYGSIHKIREYLLFKADNDALQTENQKLHAEVGWLKLLLLHLHVQAAAVTALPIRVPQNQAVVSTILGQLASLLDQQVGGEKLRIMEAENASNASMLVTKDESILVQLRQILQFLHSHNSMLTEADEISRQRTDYSLSLPPLWLPMSRELNLSRICNGGKHSSSTWKKVHIATLPSAIDALQERYQVEKVEHSASPKFKIIDKSVMIRRDSLHCDVVQTTDIAID